jgi:hypothetical protein
MATNFDKAMVPYNTDAGMAEGPAIEIEIEDPDALHIAMGGIEIDIGEEDDGFDDNLAEEMTGGELQSIASELIDLVETDINSRKDWVDAFVKGLDVLGMKANKGFDLNFYTKIFGANQTPPTLGALPSGVDPSSGAAIFGSDVAGGGGAFMPGDPGYTGTAGQTNVTNNISITAGQTFSTQYEIYEYFLNAQLAAQRAGTSTSLDNGGR